MRCGPRCSAEHGSTAVEFAILFPVFVMLAFGTISFGFAFEKWISVTQGAREASRFAATYPMPSGGVSPWLQDVKTVAKDAAGIPSDAPSGDYFVCVRFVNQIGPAPTPATTETTEGNLSGSSCPPLPSTSPSASGSPSAMPDNRAEVVVARRADLNWIFGTSSVPVSGKNISRYEPRLDP